MWSEEDSKPRRDSLRRRLLEHDRHRPVVHELDLHPRPEDACLDRNAEVAERRGEVLVRGSAASGRAARENDGRFPFAVSAMRVN